jgi:hypothetical protein
MTKKTILTTLEVRVTEDNGKIVFQPRLIGILTIMVLSALFGLAFYSASNFLDQNSILPKLFVFTSFAILGLSAVMALGAIYRIFRPQNSLFDSTQETVIVNGKSFPLEEVKFPQIETRNVGSTQMATLTVLCQGQKKVILSSTNRTVLEPVQKALAKALRSTYQFGSSVDSKEIPENPASDMFRWLRPAIFFLFGTLVATVGYFVIPDVVLGSRRGGLAALLWPLGIWILAVGLVEVFLLRRNKSLFELRPQILSSLMAVWFASYFLVCAV